MKKLLITVLLLGLVLSLFAKLYCKKEVIASSENQELILMTTGGKPSEDLRQPAVNEDSLRQNRDIILLEDFPVFTWSYGSGNTVAAMMMGYYDRLNYINMYDGPANNGLCPLSNEEFWGEGECPLSATHQGIDGLQSRGHVDDYFVYEGFEGEDPYMTGGWEPHADADCLGDFLGSNKYTFSNIDGQTHFALINNNGPIEDTTEFLIGLDRPCREGFENFILSRGYEVVSVACQVVDFSDEWDFLLSDFRHHINMGRPVLLLLESGMVLAGVGYDSSTEDIYFYDTQDQGLHYMDWYGTYAGAQLAGGVQPVLVHYGITCRFSASVLQGNPPLLVYFDNDTLGDDLSYQWDFDNDGNIDSTEENPCWIYEEAGTFSVKLYAFNEEFSDSLLKENYICVNSPPVCNLPASFTMQSGEDITINLDDYIYDADGDEISLTVTGEENLQINLDDMILCVTAPPDFSGEETLYFTVEDSLTVTEGYSTFIVYDGITTIQVPVDYTSIQQAIDASAHGTRIIVSPGTYNENFCLGDNAISLHSLYNETGDENYISQTVLTAESGNIITITSGYAPQEISGFAVTGSYQNSAVYASERPLIIHHMQFNFNMAANGSALALYGSSAAISYVSFFNNFCTTAGGTIYCQNSSPRLQNLTFYDNYAASGTAILALNYSQVTALNCLIWGNDFPNLSSDMSSSIEMTYSDLQYLVTGEGNFSADPLFVNAPEYNLHLLPDSPCIDSGDPDADGDGINWPQDEDDQDEDGSRLDIGAHPYYAPQHGSHNIISSTQKISVFPNPCLLSRRSGLQIKLAGFNLENTKLHIYNIKGQIIKSCLLNENSTGQYFWNGLDNSLQPVATGIYFIKISNENYSSFTKVVLLK